MKFSLRTLLLVSTLMSIVVGYAVLGRQQALRVIECSNEFRRLHREVERVEGTLVNQLVLQPEVVASFQEISKTEPKTTIQSLVIGSGSGGGGTHCSSGYFWESAGGEFDFTYSYLLRMPNGDCEPLIEVTISSEFDSSDIRPPVVEFSYPETDANKQIAVMIADHLEDQFEFVAVFKPIGSTN